MRRAVWVDVTDSEPLVDEPVGFVVRDLEPGSDVVVRATTDLLGCCYQAEARFTADESGEVHPARQASAGGTYEGVDAFGLWWSGRPNGPAGPPHFNPVPCRVTVTNGEGGFLAERELTRHWLGAGVTLTEVREPGVWGVFARPPGPGPGPGPGPFGGVVAFGGSSGGLGSAAAWAPVLASRGFAVLAIAYFGVPGLPDRLAEIPVETVERAAAWLLAREDVGLDRVAVMGQSRGGELALLAGASLDVIGAVVGVVPSGVVWCGFGAAGPLDVSAWSVGGKPVPYLPAVDGFPSGVGASEPVAMTPGFARLLGDEAAVRAAEIPIERIQGPILLVSGEDDAMWPSTRLSEIVERRAAATGFAHPVVHLRYPDAGHVCAGVPGTPVATEVRHPLDGGYYTFGGTGAGNAAARADSWPRVLSFLADALARPAARPSDP